MCEAIIFAILIYAIDIYPNFLFLSFVLIKSIKTTTDDIYGDKCSTLFIEWRI